MPFLSSTGDNGNNGSRARSPALSVLSTTPAIHGSNAVSTDGSLASSPTTYGGENNLTNHSSQSARSPRPWLNDIWLSQVERHELIASGYSLMTVDVVAGLDLRDAVNHLPIASLFGDTFIGWTKKSHTWPKREAKRRRTL